MKDDSERSLRHQGAWGDFFNENNLRCQGLDRRFTNREAANGFLSALDEKQRQSVLFAFDDEKQRAPVWEFRVDDSAKASMDQAIGTIFSAYFQKL
jgi:hypothetical protein